MGAEGRAALLDSSSPRYGEKASYYSAVCLETGEVEWMEPEGEQRDSQPHSQPTANAHPTLALV